MIFKQTTQVLALSFTFLALVGCAPKYSMYGKPSMGYSESVHTNTMVLDSAELSVAIGEMKMSGTASTHEKTVGKYEVISEDTMLYTVVVDSTTEFMDLAGDIQNDEKVGALVGVPLKKTLTNGKWLYSTKEELSSTQKESLDELNSAEELTNDIYPDKPIEVGYSWKTPATAWGELLGTGDDAEGDVELTLKEITEHKGQQCAVIDAVMTAQEKLDDGSLMKIDMKARVYRSLTQYEDITIDANGTVDITMDQPSMSMNMKGTVSVTRDIKHVE